MSLNYFDHSRCDKNYCTKLATTSFCWSGSGNNRRKISLVSGSMISLQYLFKLSKTFLLICIRQKISLPKFAYSKFGFCIQFKVTIFKFHQICMNICMNKHFCIWKSSITFYSHLILKKLLKCLLTYGS